ncbi:DUF5057 domain-containing protein [Isobaculum melis]|uniref:DUF5057 domain-containing protein n=1 Tax=Isobaculum melis TaxID=142588 RepID=A0A1H9TLC2_9LACT|nr:hypothetical protein [Isobaculum melis]SER97951.1 hypothetical protein SAMN04488559_11454 [Isobaculum melis]
MRIKIVRKRNKLKLFGLILLIFTGLQSIQPLHIEASHVIKKGDFKLTAENKWDAVEEKNYAELHWDQVENLASTGYTLYQSTDGTKFEPIPINYRKKINVLNIYPDVAASNTLKGWMDGLGLKDVHGDSLIQVTACSITEFNANPNAYLKDSAGNYKYDVMMFGSWDVYGGKDLTEQSYAATRAFSDSGRGVLFGHDTVYFAKPQFMKYAKDLGVTTTSSVPGVAGVGHNQVRVIDNGYLMKYPFELKNNMELTIPYTHILQHKLKANQSKIWLNFTGSSSIYANPIIDNATLTNNWYLITNQNVAMIQTGHSGGQSTPDEQKIIANTLYNLAQVSQDNFTDDFTVKDSKAPDIPDVSIIAGKPVEELELSITANDKGTPYQWYVEAETKVGTNKISDTVEEEIISDMAGYIYEIDDNPTTLPKVEVDEYGKIKNINLPVTLPNKKAILTGLDGVADANKWLHIVAVDRAHNVSEVKHLQIKDLLPAFQIKQKYTDVDDVEIKPVVTEMVTAKENYQVTPPVIAGYLITGYQIDKEARQKLDENETVTITAVSNHHQVAFIYQKINKLHVRQVITEAYDQLVLPKTGFVTVNQIDGNNELQIGAQLNSKILSELEIATPNFTEISLRKLTAYQGMSIKPMIPSYYTYAGYRLSQTKEDHLATPLITDSWPLVKAVKDQEYWLTIYLSPTSESPRPYSGQSQQLEIGTLIP